MAQNYQDKTLIPQAATEYILQQWMNVQHVESAI